MCQCSAICKECSLHAQLDFHLHHSHKDNQLIALYIGYDLDNHQLSMHSHQARHHLGHRVVHQLVLSFHLGCPISILIFRSSSTPAAVSTSSASAGPTYANSTVVVVAPTTPASSVVAPIATSAPSITPAPNAANKALAASSACLVGLIGLAAYFL